MNETLLFIGDVVMAAALVSATVFGISYAAFFNWRLTTAGRSLFYFIWALILWAAQSFAARLNPDYLGREYVRLVVYVLVLATVLRLLVTLWRSYGKPFQVTPRNPKEK